MSNIQRVQRQAGATIVEVLVAIALTGIMLPALASALVTSHAGKATAIQQLQATTLMHEATDAVRSVREAGWTNIATDGTYHPVISGSIWSLSAGSETINGFTRQIVISTVQRDSSNVIVSSGGTDDPSTKKVVVKVSWTTPVTGSVSNTTYLTRWQNNTTWTQTTQTDFNAGTFNNTSSTNTSGGEVQLNGGGSGVTWANPAQAGSYNISGTTDANDVYVDTSTNRAYVVNGAGMSIIDVSTPSSPTLLGTFVSSSQINGVYVVGNYAYLASTNNTAELTVVNVSNPASPTQAGSLNLGDTADATSVFVTGGYAYVGKILSTTNNVNEFYIINISNPAAPTLSGSLNLTGSINSVYVSGNYAYLATAVTTAELTVVDISVKTAPVIAGTYDSAGTAAGTDVFYNGGYIYLTEANNTGGPEFFLLDVSAVSSISLVGSYEVGANVNGVFAYGSRAFLVGAASAKQFMVLDLATPSAPILEGSSNVSTANDVYVANDTAYVASTSNNSELIVMQGSASNGGQTASGTYESPTFDAGSLVSFNYLSFTVNQPTGTTVTFKVATNNDNTTWNYVGPDGTAFSEYTTPASIALNVSNARYFRYKVFLDTTTKSVLPLIYDVTVNYSP